MIAAKIERAFFDANILVYSDDRRDPGKNERARELIREHLRSGTGAVSMQVLTEYFVAVTRKFKIGLDPLEAQRKVELLSSFDVVSPRLEDLVAAIKLSRKLHCSLWDTLVIRAAIQAGCRVLLTEDLQHGQVIEGVEIRNPFL